jgi:16S rRNA processing protein RimM
MKNRVHPIATITTTSGLSGDVRLRPLSRYFDDYIEEKNLMLGFSPDASEDIRLEVVRGMGKKRRFKFEGVNSVSDAEKIVGQTIFVEAQSEDGINLIGKDLLGYDVFAESGDFVGTLKDVMWLPGNDAYVIKNGEKEILIPVIPEVVKGMDHETGVIVISLMDGLLD